MGPFARPGDAQGESGWRRAPIESIEDLRDAVLRADLDPTQFGRAPITGSLAFLEADGVVLSSGLFDSRVALRGSLSADRLTIGFGLRLGGGSRQWLRDVETGEIGVFRAGDDHDALYGPRSLYLTVTMSHERLMAEAEQLEIVVDERSVRHSGIHPRSLDDPVLRRLRAQLDALHNEAGAAEVNADLALAVAIRHLGRAPAAMPGLRRMAADERIVARAREFIAGSLDQPIGVTEIAKAAATSRRSLSRAFAHVLGDSPASYVNRVRLHRIRRELVSESGLAQSVAAIANKWGVSELGRFSGQYKTAFGELPSETRAASLSGPYARSPGGS